MKIELSIKKNGDKIKIQRIGRALADLKRLEILNLISNNDNEQFNYGDLAREISRSPTSITNHMNWIREGGLTEDLAIEGKRGKMQKIPKLKITKIVINLK